MGLLRFVLACGVIGSHCGGLQGFVFLPGRESVSIFYVMSGFYMAMVLNEKYFGKGSTLIFYASRYLRIWPAYIFTLFLFVTFINLSSFNSLYSSASNGVKVLSIFSNLFILGSDLLWFLGISPEGGKTLYAAFNSSKFSNAYNLSLILPIFTVSLELCFYFLAPFFVRSNKRTLVVFVLSILFHFVIYKYRLDPISYGYHALPGAVFYFILGVLAYRCRNFRFSSDTIMPYLSIFFLVWLTSRFTLIANLLYILPFIFCIPKLFEMFKYSRIDRFIGDLSYPLYLTHWFVLKYIKTHIVVPEKYLGISVLFGALVLSLVINLLIETRINIFRTKLLGYIKIKD